MLERLKCAAKDLLACCLKLAELAKANPKKAAIACILVACLLYCL
jgi:hypothetical protein